MTTTSRDMTVRSGRQVVQRPDQCARRCVGVMSGERVIELLNEG